MASINTIVKSVTIAPGESFTLPSGATVISISDTLQNSCDFELPPPEVLTTYYFRFSVNQDSNDDHPMGSEVNIESFLVNGVIAPLEFTFFNTDNAGNQAGILVWNSEVAYNNTLLTSYPIKFTAVNYDAGTAKSDLVTAVVKMPVSYLPKVFLKIRNDKFPDGLYIKGSL